MHAKIVTRKDRYTQRSLKVGHPPVDFQAIEETGDRRNVPQLFDERKFVNVPSVPSF
jgi:hypothetical protein